MKASTLRKEILASMDAATLMLGDTDPEVRLIVNGISHPVIMVWVEKDYTRNAVYLHVGDDPR